MNFSEAQEFLHQDGSLRDIYVLSTSDSQLNTFLDYVRPLLSESDFLIDGHPASLPSTYFGVMMDTQEASCILHIPVGSGTVNCHFFDSSELELDFNPIDYSDEKSWNKLSSFLQGLTNAMKQELIITPENTQEEVYILYKPIQ